MDQDSDSEEQTIDYSAKLVEYKETDRDLSYSFEGLVKAGQIFGFSIYAIYEDSRAKFYDYGVIFNDLKKIYKFRVLPQNVLFNGGVEEFVFLDDDVIEILKKKIEVVNVYVFHRLLWPDMYLDYKKMEEFEITFNLMKDNELMSICNLISQKDMCGYKADCLFTLRSTILDSSINVPDVVLEIDENEHKDRDKKEEDKRQKFIESLGHRFYRIPVKKHKKPERENETKRNKIFKELKDIAKKAAEKLKMVMSDLTIEYTPDISPEKLVEMAEEFDIDKELVKIYFPGDKREINGPFFIYYKVVGKYLDYSDDANNGMQYLKELIKRELKENIDYFLPLGIPGDKEKYGKSNAKNYMLSRVGFYRLCVSSRKPKAKEASLKIVKMYDCVLNYVKKLRAQLIKNTPLKCKEKVKYVEDQIKYKRDINEEKRLTSKLKEENKELKDENKKMKIELEEFKEIARRNKATIKDLERKCDRYFAQEMYEKRKKEGLIYDSSEEDKPEVKRKPSKKENKKISKEEDTSEEDKPEVKKKSSKEGDNNSEGEENDNKELIAKYEKKTVVQLKEICRKNYLSNYHKLRKTELIELIINKVKK
jgi:very-short-patch-repair endonuclease